MHLNLQEEEPSSHSSFYKAAALFSACAAEFPLLPFAFGVQLNPAPSSCNGVYVQSQTSNPNIKFRKVQSFLRQTLESNQYVIGGNKTPAILFSGCC